MIKHLISTCLVLAAVVIAAGCHMSTPEILKVDPKEFPCGYGGPICHDSLGGCCRPTFACVAPTESRAGGCVWTGDQNAPDYNGNFTWGSVGAPRVTFEPRVQP